MTRSSSIIGAVFVLTCFSVNSEEYSHCATDDQSEVCQAYLSGVKINCKEALQELSLAEENNVTNENSFMTRALEQRAGQRVRSNIGM